MNNLFVTPKNVPYRANLKRGNYKNRHRISILVYTTKYCMEPIEKVMVQILTLTNVLCGLKSPKIHAASLMIS